MHRIRTVLLLLLLSGGPLMSGRGEGSAPLLPPAPEAREEETTDVYHGISIRDPYRWLEDPDSPETSAWVDAQNRRTEAYLASNPFVEPLRRRLTEVWDYERMGAPVKEAGWYFYTRNSGLQNQSPVYRRKPLDGPEQLVLDPNTLSADGTVALGEWAVDSKGRHLAYLTAASGSDWNECRIRDLESSRTLEDHLKWIKFTSLAWDEADTGIFYGRYPEPKGQALTETNYHHRIYWHRVGTPQSEDRLVCERPDDKELGFSPVATDDRRFLVLYVSRGTDVKNGLYVAPLPAGGGPPRPEEVVRLLEVGRASFSLIGNVGRTFYLLTNDQAPRGRVIAVDLDRPEPEHWRTIVAQGSDIIPEGNVTLLGDQLIVNALRDARAVVLRYDLQGKLLGEIALPGPGTVSGFQARRHDGEVFFLFQSPTDPPTVYRYDASADRVELVFQPKVDFRAEDYVTTQTFATSRDGTRVPLFITARRDLKLDGRNPTRLYGYGGFSVTETPYFRVTNLPWLERGGVFVSTVLRGGGEYGEEWHQDGMLAKKQNTFDDFLAAAEYLIREGYTSPERLGIEGGSNGGLLVGAAVTQKPELFGAACPLVGVLDMLRFHRFTIGWAWVPEYGSAEDPDQFQCLLRYSPLHNIREGTRYPALLAMTGDHDDRVVPAHTYKFTAALQKAQKGEKAVLVRVDRKSGHGAGKPTSKRIEETAVRLAFMARELGME